MTSSIIPDMPTLQHNYYLEHGTAAKRIRDGLHMTDTVPVKITKDEIFIGCARITVEAAKFILDKHKEHFETGPVCVVL